MKKFLGALLVLVYSCTTTNDGTTNTNDGNTTTTTLVPLPPTNLIGTVASATQINLSWTDNSTNETGFKIERKTGSGIYVLVGTTTTDLTTFNDKGLTPCTDYVYRVYSYNSGGNSPTYSNEIALTSTAILPSVATTNSSDITAISATSGGAITADGGATITARGIVWSTSPSPTINLITKTTDGIGIGNFTSNITNLYPSTIYYIRAYATNCSGTSYGSEVSFSTSAAPIQSVVIGTQTWSSKNAEFTTYRDGTPITQVSDINQLSSWIGGAWCYYNMDSSNGTVYGKLYNAYAILGIYNYESLDRPSLRKEFAPTGWHVPTLNDWNTLSSYLGGELIAGAKMKEIGTSHWNSPNTDATNSSGFTGLGSGILSYEKRSFVGIKTVSYFWSSTEGGIGSQNIELQYRFNISSTKSEGTIYKGPRYNDFFSVRLIKN